MKKLILISLLLCSAAGAKDIADWTKFPGSRQKGQCHPYAMAVEQSLKASGHAAFYVAYAHANGEHAVVIFRSGNRWRMVDNEHAYSFAVKGSTVLELVRCLNSSASRVVESAVPMPLGNL